MKPSVIGGSPSDGAGRLMLVGRQDGWAGSRRVEGCVGMVASLVDDADWLSGRGVRSERDRWRSVVAG